MHVFMLLLRWMDWLNSHLTALDLSCSGISYMHKICMWHIYLGSGRYRKVCESESKRGRFVSM